MKKKYKPIIYFSIIIGIILIAYFGFKPLVLVNSNNFANPDWARLECSPSDSYDYSFVTTIDQTNLFKCNGFTEECRMKIRDNYNSNCLGIFYPGGKYYKCDINGNNCDGGYNYALCEGKETGWDIINLGQSFKFDTGILIGGEDRTEVTFQYKPWKVYRFVGGSKTIVNSANCDITSSLKAGIRNVDYPGSKLYRIGGEGQKWINYVNSWNLAPPTNVFTYNGKEVYCNNAKLYDIVSLTMADGTIRKLNPSYSDTTESGDVISGMGSFIKNVECCPNEPNCNDNFEYSETPNTCFTDVECLNSGGPVPISGTQYIKQVCENDICVQKGPFTVDCTNNAMCPEGKICDLSTLNYGNCINQIPGGYCGDGVCDSLLGESNKTCPSDCGKNKGNGECQSCMDWVSNFIKSDDKKCKETTIIDTVWYNPFTWINALGITSQGVICPILLSVVAIVGIFTFLFGLDFLDRFKSIRGKKKRWIRIIIAIVLALILSYVTYVAFWIGVVLFVLFLIIKFTLKSMIPI